MVKRETLILYVYLLLVLMFTISFRVFMVRLAQNKNTALYKCEKADDGLAETRCHDCKLQF